MREGGVCATIMVRSHFFVKDWGNLSHACVSSPTNRCWSSFPSILSRLIPLLLCCSSLLCEAMLKRKRDLDLLSMLHDIDNKIECRDDDLAPAAPNKDEVTHMLHKYDDVETPFGQLVSSLDFRPTPTDDP